MANQWVVAGWGSVLGSEYRGQRTWLVRGAKKACGGLLCNWTAGQANVVPSGTLRARRAFMVCEVESKKKVMWKVVMMASRLSSIFHGELQNNVSEFPSIVRVRLGIALSRVCTPLLSSGKLRAEAFKLTRVSAQHCVIGPGIQTRPQPTWIGQRIMTFKMEQFPMTHSYVCKNHSETFRKLRFHTLLSPPWKMQLSTRHQGSRENDKWHLLRNHTERVCQWMGHCILHVMLGCYWKERKCRVIQRALVG